MDSQLPEAEEVVNLRAAPAKTFLSWEVRLQGTAYICDVKCRHNELYTANIFDLLGDRFRKEAKMARNTRITMKSTTHASLFRKTFVHLARLQDLLLKHGEKLSVSSLESGMCQTEGVWRLWWLSSTSCVLQLLCAVLKDVAVWHGVQHFGCLHLECKKLWFCFIRGREKKIGRKKWLELKCVSKGFYEMWGLLLDLCWARQTSLPRRAEYGKITETK